LANRDILTIGASAGGVEALLRLAREFSGDLPASVLVTLHLPARARSSLDELMSKAGPLPAQFATDGEPLRKRRIYIAPPDRHLLVYGDKVCLGIGPRENNSRPSVDAMMRSAAVCCGGRAIGVVLTGTLGDGASGLWAVGQCGGITVVQDPRGAAFAEMPQAALERVQADHIVDLSSMALLLESLVHQPAGESLPAPASVRYEVEVARKGTGAMAELDHIGRRSVLSCPDCQGTMWEIDEGELVRFRCHVGHTYTAELMSLALDESLRRALASAQRAFEERVALAGKLHRQATESGHRILAENWAAKLQEYQAEMNSVVAAIRRMEAIVARQEREEFELLQDQDQAD
jgi:two-component system chemotaxis response regulator CheB